MKFRLTSLIIAFCTLLALLSFSDSRPKKLFNGVWQFAGTVNGGQSLKPRIIEMKVFNNGKFEGYLMRPEGSIKTMNGTYRIPNDSVYTETLIYSANRLMVGKTYVIKYKLKGNLMTAVGFYDAPNNGVALRVNYNQDWERIDYQDWDKQYHMNQ